MIIAFCGHSRYYGFEKLGEEILNVLETEIGNADVDFYLGNYGKFDYLAEKSCKLYQRAHPNSKLFFVTPYTDEKYLKNKVTDKSFYDGIIYPEIENTPKPYAILERNKWIVKRADLLVAFVNYSYGGAYKMLDFARRSKKRYINLGTYNFD